REGPARSEVTATESDGAERGRGLFAHRGKPGWHNGSGAVFEAPGLVAGFDDFAVMRQSIEQRGRHLGVCEDAWPFAEGQVGRDDDGGALVKAADQMEEQLAAGLGEREIAEFVEDDEVEPGQVIGEAALPAGTGFTFQPINEVDDGVKAAPRAATDARAGDRYCKVAFAGAGPPDQHGVALLGNEVAGLQLADQGLVDWGSGEVEVVDIVCQR